MTRSSWRDDGGSYQQREQERRRSSSQWLGSDIVDHVMPASSSSSPGASVFLVLWRPESGSRRQLNNFVLRWIPSVPPSPATTTTSSLYIYIFLLLCSPTPFTGTHHKNTHTLFYTQSQLIPPLPGTLALAKISQDGGWSRAELCL